MDPIPLPSHIHYELLLQLLERQTMHAIGRKSPQQEQLHELIATLRKAFTQQKHLEESCERASLPIDYRWSLNQISGSRKGAEPDLPNPAIATPIVMPPVDRQAVDLQRVEEPPVASGLEEPPVDTQPVEVPLPD